MTYPARLAASRLNGSTRESFPALEVNWSIKKSNFDSKMKSPPVHHNFSFSEGPPPLSFQGNHTSIFECLPLLTRNLATNRQPFPSLSGVFVVSSMWPTSWRPNRTHVEYSVRTEESTLSCGPHTLIAFTYIPKSSWISRPTYSHPKLGKAMSNWMGTLSLSPGLCTNNSEWRSTVIKVRNSESNRKKMKHIHATEMQAPKEKTGKPRYKPYNFLMFRHTRWHSQPSHKPEGSCGLNIHNFLFGSAPSPPSPSTEFRGAPSGTQLLTC